MQTITLHTVDEVARQMRVFRADLPGEDEEPELVAYWPECAVRESG